MKHEVIVPSAGESVNEVFIAGWRKKNGDLVKKDEVLVDLETQKASFELQSEFGGRLEVLFPKADTKVKPGDVIAYVDDGPGAQDGAATSADTVVAKATPSSFAIDQAVSPAARKMASEKNVDLSQVSGSGKGGVILKEDVLKASEAPAKAASTPAPSPASAPASASPVLNYQIDESRGERRVPASRIRRQIATNLVAAQHTAAILTTFNEVDMTQILEFRKKYKDKFKEKFGVGLGMVSPFALACVRAMKLFPQVNNLYTGEDIIQRDFVDLSIAVNTDHGLVVPVLRNVDKMNVADFEKKLTELAEKARARKLSIPEMTGGTFTITNGGVFGSLVSTPILNMPQSAILGLHKTQERPVVVEKQIVVRPMMYLALSYDHRIIDGREAVGFLVAVKEGIENLSLIINEKELF